jgi:hypothetical protein
MVVSVGEEKRNETIHVLLSVMQMIKPQGRKI